MIDTDLLDDLFLVALAEDFSVDQPGRSSAAHRALNKKHLVDLMKHKGMRLVASL